MKKRYMAIDFGASSGRVMVGEWAEGRLTLRELHRFPNQPVRAGAHLYWDVLRLFHEIKQGLLAAKQQDMLPDSIGIDTWGVDFGLLDKDGRLLENPVHYRDTRTAGIPERVYETVPPEELYRITGNQIMPINTLFQVAHLAADRPELLACADRLLMMPDLFVYLLTGQAATDASIASTTQMTDAAAGVWAFGLLERLKIPTRLLTEIVPPGSAAGRLTPALCRELDIPPIPVVRVAGHDTQSAAAAVPFVGTDELFISSGTWSLVGAELDAPVLTPQAAALNVTNEAGVGGTVTFMKNLPGLWLVQESRRRWQQEGRSYSYAQMEEMARAAPSGIARIPTEHPLFQEPGDIPRRIREYCRESPIPAGDGAVIRVIYESLADSYRQAKADIERCTGRRYTLIHTVGGGAQDQLLRALTEEACGCPVRSGPVEATVAGNIMVQMIADGQVPDLRRARAVIQTLR